MGGEIGVESHVGRGSTFWFTARLPVSMANNLSLLTPPPASTLRGLRVLAIDDNAAYREILREHVAGWGCEVDVAADGEDAMRRLTDAAREGRPYRVAIIDLILPGMSGVSLRAPSGQTRGCRGRRCSC